MPVVEPVQNHAVRLALISDGLGENELARLERTVHGRPYQLEAHVLRRLRYRRPRNRQQQVLHRRLRGGQVRLQRDLAKLLERGVALVVVWRILDVLVLDDGLFELTPPLCRLGPCLLLLPLLPPAFLLELLVMPSEDVPCAPESG